MTQTAHRALLPAGLTDVLPPDAAFEARVREGLVQRFSRYGYDRVKPPLIEFEDNLISGSGAATASQTFRLMDPVSQRMLGVRPDMTLQIARIATTRLADEPRPLRLSYAGEVLRVRGSSLRPERQFAQVGAEIIGSPSPEADAEVILMAYEALAGLGLAELTVDLGLPTLVPAICAALGIDLDEIGDRIRPALNQKDATAIAALGGGVAEALGALLDAVGPAASALKALNGLALPDDGAVGLQHLQDVVSLISRGAPGLKMTVDPVEIRGYEYHTGVTFTLFALGSRGELGRGGRYLAGNGEHGGEPATGMTLFLDAVIRALPAGETEQRLFLPAGSDSKTATRLREEGWIAIQALDEALPAEEAARAHGCSHILVNDEIRKITPAEKDT